MGDLKVTTGDHGAFTVLALAGELDEATVGDAETHILTAIVAAPAPVRLVLDLTGVTFLTSAGVNVIAKTHFAVQSSRGRLSLVVPEGSGARRVLELTGLATAIPTFPEPAAAFAEL